MSSISKATTTIRQLLLPLGIAWIILLCIFTGVMIAVHLIPASAVVRNTATSVSQLYEIPQPPATPIFPGLLQSDKFTDRIILDMVRSADTSHPVEAAMLNFIPANDLQYDDAEKIFGEGASEDYARYWQGHQVMARIAMTFTTLRPIVIFNTVAGALLLIAVTVGLWRRLSARYAVTFALFIILSGFPLTLLSLQLTDIYFISFLAMLSILNIPTLSATPRNLAITFFTIGAVTTFFDFLTFPIFTLCFPLVTVLLLQQSSSRSKTFIPILSWGLGYGLLWASKWIIGTLLTGTDLFVKAADGINERTGAIPEDALLLVIIVAVIALLLAVAAYIGRRKNYRLNTLLLIGCVPVVWFAVLKNHSIVHFQFTWRILLITLFCIITYYFVNHGGKEKNSDTDSLLQ